jgi:hypothetical protein
MRGRVVVLSRPRRLIGDLMHFAAGVPSVPVQRRMQLAPLVAARRAGTRPPWAALFAKAFALVAAGVPELRRAYCKFPRPHLYEYPVSVASVAVEREVEGERAVLGVRVIDPAGRPLDDMVRAVRRGQTAPVEEVKEFRRALRFSGLPRPARRLLWWIALNYGRIRPNYFGTFGISSYAALGAESLHPISPLSYALTYGAIGADGAVDVRLIYDHRVTDGATIARALVELESALNGPVLEEVESGVPAPPDRGSQRPVRAILRAGGAL